MWCDARVMAQSASFGVYCRRWGVPRIDGGTRAAGALEIIRGRKVTAEESYRIGLCEKVVPPGQARAAAETMALEVAHFPQACVRALGPPIGLSPVGKVGAPGLESEWSTSAAIVEAEGIAGATRFAEGKGRHGDFRDI
jgi:enoyl-CoA hydratase